MDEETAYKLLDKGFNIFEIKNLTKEEAMFIL